MTGEGGESVVRWERFEGEVEGRTGIENYRYWEGQKTFAVYCKKEKGVNEGCIGAEYD